MLHTPENDSASAGALQEVFTDLRTWLVETGHPAATNQAPLGVSEYAGPLVANREIVPLAPKPEAYRRFFEDADGTHFLVPWAASVLALGRQFSFVYYGACLLTADPESPPERYTPASCMLSIPGPHLPDTPDTVVRIYRFARIRNSKHVIGMRHDRSEQGFLIEEPITVAENEVIAEVGRACMTFFASEREFDFSHEQRR